MKYIAIDKPYGEFFTEVIERLSAKDCEDVQAIGTVVLLGDRQWICFFGNSDTLDKFTMAGIMQNEASEDRMEMRLEEMQEEDDGFTDFDSSTDGE